MVLINTPGDAVISLCADFQDPPNLIPQFVRIWESGSKVVLGRKNSTNENQMYRILRPFYYSLLAKAHGHSDMEKLHWIWAYDGFNPGIKVNQ